jgi:hypothetical protein
LFGFAGGSFNFSTIAGNIQEGLSNNKPVRDVYPLYKNFKSLCYRKQGWFSDIGIRLCANENTLTSNTSSFYPVVLIDDAGNSGDNSSLLYVSTTGRTFDQTTPNLTEIDPSPGSVPYNYYCGQNLVTNLQWVTFLNAISASATDFNSIFPYNDYTLINNRPNHRHPLFSIPAGDYRSSTRSDTVIMNEDLASITIFTDPLLTSNSQVYSKRDGIIKNTAGSNFYFTVKPGFENKPANFIGWLDAARFCNWMHNGMPTGVMAASSTEDGAYDLTGEVWFNGSITKTNSTKLKRKPNAKWFLPNPNEWYKAAYYDRSAGGFICEATSVNNSDHNIFIGADAGRYTTSSDSSIAIGYSAQTYQFNNAIVVGEKAQALHTNSLVLGSQTYPVTGYVYGPLSAWEHRSQLGTFDTIRVKTLSADTVYGNIELTPVFNALSATDYFISEKGLQVNNTVTLTSYKITNTLTTSVTSFTGTEYFIKVIINDNTTKYLRLFDIN